MIDRFTISSKGDSMFPLLQDGDLIEFEKTLPRHIKFNDIVLIYQSGVFVTHRIIYISGKHIVARGDNNKHADKQLPIESVLAKAIRFKRNNKWHYIQEVYSSQSLSYIVEIRRLVSMMNLAKIKHVFLKGVMVALHYESHVPQRIYSDCDFLIQRKQFNILKGIFEEMGYKKIIDPAIGSLSDEEAPEVSFIKLVGKTPVIFDVHLEPVFLMTKLGGMDLLYPKVKREQLGGRLISLSKKVKIGGFTYSLLTPSMQILYLALHVFHHNYTDIVRLNLLDAVIKKAIRQKKLWNQFAEVAISFSLHGYVAPVLTLLKTYFKTPIPQSVSRRLKIHLFESQTSKWVISSVDVFSEGYRIKAGIQRFILILLLSPEPLYKKLMIFIYPSTIQSILWVVGKRLGGRLEINSRI